MNSDLSDAALFAELERLRRVCAARGLNGTGLYLNYDTTYPSPSNLMRAFYSVVFGVTSSDECPMEIRFHPLCHKFMQIYYRDADCVQLVEILVPIGMRPEVVNDDGVEVGLRVVDSQSIFTVAVPLFDVAAVEKALVLLGVYLDNHEGYKPSFDDACELLKHFIATS